jgi:hypothetical protein
MTMTTTAPVTTARTTTWLEAGDRDVMQPGWKEALADSPSVDGVVLRPSALVAAVAGGGRFDRVIRHLSLATGVTARAAVTQLIASELRSLADALGAPARGGSGATRWAVGWADPRAAHDSVALFSDARALSRRAARSNVMVTVPATDAGLRTFEWLVAEGVPTHVALVPSPDRLRATVAAYVAGLQARLARRLPLAVDAVVSPAPMAVAADMDALAAEAWHTIEGRDTGTTLARLVESGAKPPRLAVPGAPLPGDDLAWAGVIRVLPADARGVMSVHHDDDAAVDEALAGEVAAYDILAEAVSAHVTVIQRELQNVVGCPICLEARGA